VAAIGATASLIVEMWIERHHACLIASEPPCGGQLDHNLATPQDRRTAA
jgi:hypothetical protein